MTRTTETRTVKNARAVHACDWCAEPIRVGESYVCWRVFEGRIGETVRMHPECRQALVTCDDVRRDGCWFPGTYRRGCWCEDGTEECDCGIERKETLP